MAVALTLVNMLVTVTPEIPGIVCRADTVIGVADATPVTVISSLSPTRTL